MAEVSLAELNRIERIRNVAPELLEALKDLIAIGEAYAPRNNAIEARLDAARSTIAKATDGEG